MTGLATGCGGSVQHLSEEDDYLALILAIL